MSEKLRWGILATGSIAHQFASGLAIAENSELVSTGSRTLARAEEFAAKHGGAAYGSYEEVLADANVDAVYIATPHAMHAEWTIKAALAGKAVLCEKPFTLNSIEAKRAIHAVREAGTFFMEAFMYRCAPQTRKLVELLREEAIGKVCAINSEFAFHAGHDWTNFRATNEGGGGGLMDVGSYCVSLSRLVAGCEPDRAEFVAHLGAKGYDEWGNGILHFPNDVTAAFGTGIHLNMKNDARIYGSDGWIHIESPWKASKGALMHLYRNGKEAESFDLGVNNDELYAREADAVAEFVGQGECPYMSIDDTLGQMDTLDRLRKSAGLHFQGEPSA
ncbi:MAG: Gfo/Idh/MocA family oxidoreductase [Fimbriimonadaceae bacterium]|nr:Gfo/Idh/MocA family oxidoreductase [Fimbriimonadaceae bacterium]